jgi:hypothetical protein
MSFEPIEWPSEECEITDEEALMGTIQWALLGLLALGIVLLTRCPRAPASQHPNTHSALADT